MRMIKAYVIAKQLSFWIMMIIMLWSVFEYMPELRRMECCACIDGMPYFNGSVNGVYFNLTVVNISLMDNSSIAGENLQCPLGNS